MFDRDAHDDLQRGQGIKIAKVAQSQPLGRHRATLIAA
jgi:hypothetical protein